MIWMQLYILFWHWVADFIGQTREMGINKSTSIKWLNKHIISYGNHLLYGSLPLLGLGIYFGKNWALVIIIYVTINMALHWVTDYFTSKWTAKLYKQGNMRMFWIVIGLDQFIHGACLLLTHHWLVN